MVYKRREGSRVSVDPQTVGDALEDIAARNGGMVVPKAVVRESRPQDAPLHDCFEWDNRTAAALFRENQARQIIRSVVIVNEQQPKGSATRVVQAYVHVNPGGSTPCYVSSARVVSEPELRDQALREAVGYLRGAQKRFNGIKELGRVFREIDIVAEEVESRVLSVGAAV